MPAASVVDAVVYASHHQFYVLDPDGPRGTDLVWDGAGLERHLGVADGVVAVGTVGSCDVPVRIEVWDERPPLDLEAWEHVVEASLDVSSGKIELHGVEGPAELEPIAVVPGTYGVRSSAAGLDDADEMEGGDRYRVQLWPAPPLEPHVLEWWSAWDPAGVVSRPATAGRQLLVGAEAEDRRRTMRWLASAGRAHLFRDAEGALWEHTNLADASGTPQLEELDAVEAERRYGSSVQWGAAPMTRPSAGRLLRNVWRTWRYSRGWRPPPDSS